MEFLFGLKKKEKKVLIFDIGSGSVGGALVHIPDDEKKLPMILKSARTEIVFHNEQNIRVLFKDMLSALNFTATSLHREKVGSVDGIYCVMSSPWYFSKIRNILHKDKKQFTFTDKMADKIINKEVLELDNLYQEHFENIKSEPEVIEHQTMGASINGYSISDPINKKIKEIELNTIISLSPKIYLDKIRQTLLRNFYHNHIKINFSSFIIDSYLAVRDRYKDINSYLLIDISGEMTDIGIVENGVIKFSLSFPFGKKSFFNYICTKLEIELRDAEELFRLYSSGNISASYKEKVKPLFKSVENSWGEAFRQCIDVLPRTFIIPSTIFLTADNDIKDWFTTIVCKKSQIEGITSNEKCVVKSLSGNEFLGMCSVEEGTCDPFLMIEAIAVARKIKK